jgi:lipopolysaccharide/colanic/teichoic acid biosynthesis glycosyltransferase
MANSTFSKIEFPFLKKEIFAKIGKYRKSFDNKKDDFPIKSKVNKTYVKKLLKKEIGDEAYSLIDDYIDIENNSSLVISTVTRFNIDKYTLDTYNNIVNIKLINDIRWLNKFFESVNSRIPIGGYFIGRFEAKINRKNRILKTLFPPFNWIHYTIDFLHKRVAPKVKYTKKLYFYISKGKSRVLTRAETLGRLVSCGFEIISHADLNNVTWFVVKKVGKPSFDLMPSYSALFKMNRIGKDGKTIGVYKFRTMHPYAEYLQDYVYSLNGYDKETGKIANDFRLTTWGKFLRKYWLDELPQLINVMRGEMKLVGVRPISKSLYDQYPDELKLLRDKYKPGCIPPYVALLMDEMNDSMEAERIYLLEKEKHPFWTDIKYIRKAISNILLNKIRSS